MKDELTEFEWEPIHQCFASQVERFPNRVAVIDEKQSITFAELNQRANRLARFLRSQGVRRNQVVGILCSRSVELIIGLWAIWKAGGAFLPLDPRYPKARIAYMLRDSKAKVLLTESEIEPEFDFSGRVVTFGCAKNETSENLSIVNQPEDLAYVIYTSGSTGYPKGVMITHKNISHMQSIQLTTFCFQPSYTYLTLASVSFDIFLAESLLPLSFGLCIVIAPEDLRTQPEDLGAYMLDKRVDIWQSTVSHIRMMLHDEKAKKALQALKVIILGGEPLPTKLVQQIQQVSSAHLYNAYGPTETTIYATVKSIDQGPVTIGKALPGYRCYVWNERRQQVPVGETGELYIGGLGVGKGYLGLTEQNQQHFFVDPIHEGERIYRTGDRVRLLPNGELEFIGRIDQQVKINGYRIELGEVEAAMLRIPAIEEAIVVVENQTLMAFYVAEQPISSNKIKAELAKQLPDYMIPARSFYVSQMPLTSNGKIDRQALIQKKTTPSQPPKTDREKVLVATWEKILKRNPIGLHDNFFALGGESIKAIQIASLLQQKGWSLEMRQIMDHPTIAELSTMLKKRRIFPSQEEIVGVAPLSPIQAWFFEQSFSEEDHWNQSFLFFSEERYHPEWVEQVLWHLTAHHDMLRAVFQQGQTPIQVIRSSEERCFELHVMQVQGEEEIAACVEPLQRKLSLAQGPLMQVAILQTDRGDYLFWTIHHLLVDSVSWQILWQDFQQGYEQAQQGEQIIFPSKTHSFQAWTQSLHEYAQSPALLDEIPYWQEFEKRLEPEMLFDRQVNHLPSGEAKKVSVQLSKKWSQILQKHAPSYYQASILDLLLAALHHAWQQTIKEPKPLLLQLEKHGRHSLATDLDLTRTVGWFTASYPLLLADHKIDHWQQRIEKVKEAIQQMDHYGMGYGLLKYLTPPEKKRVQLDWQPRLSFNYLGKWEMKGLKEWQGPQLGTIRGPLSEMPFPLEINSIDYREQLQITFHYHPAVWSEEVIVEWANAFQFALQEIAIEVQKNIDEKQTQSFAMTDVQLAYLMGRNPQFALGGVSTHGYIELETQLDISRLNRALQKAIARHPMLRAILLPNGRQQILSNVPPYKIVIEDVREMSPREREQKILDERERMSHQIFPLGKWPLFAWKAFRLDEQRHVLCFSWDVIIMDGSSVNKLIEELIHFYHQPDLELPAFTFHFSDYIQAYQQRKQTAAYAQARAYWKRKIPTLPFAPSLPLQKDLHQVTKPRFSIKHHFWNEKDWRAIQRWARRHHLTPSALLCAIYGEVLAYWSNQPDLTINVTVFDREPVHAEVESLIGDFTSLVLLDLHWKPGESLLSRAKQTQHTLLDGLKYRIYDGVQVIRDFCQYHGLRTQAAMPVIFTSLLASAGASYWNQIGQLRYLNAQTPQVYLDHIISEENGELHTTWNYVEELLAPSMIDSMFTQFVQRVQQLIDEEQDIQWNEAMRETTALQVGNRIENRLQWRETEEFVQRYNQTKTLIPAQLLHGLFQQQASFYPEQVAVVLDDESLTYAELDRRSNQVARYLQSQGVSSHEFVGVEVNRELETVVNLLGVLKAGAAYVPIDPEFPPNRQNYIRQQSRCRLTLTVETYQQEGLSQYKDEEVESLVSPSDPAYVMFTSGSTGRPKGAVLSHEAVCNTIQDINQRFGIDAEDRFLCLSSFSFDLSVFDLFGAFHAGATVVILKDARDMPTLVETVKRRGITIWNSVPAVMELALAFFGQNKQDSLRLVLLSGDWIPLTLPNQVQALFPQAKVISLGGATEASIWSIYYPITEVKEEWNSIPYGYPLANQQYYVLNYEQEICPVGVEGELYIGGRGLAKGYLGEMEKTAAAFIDHPRWGRLYRTGDYGRWHASGYLEFRGRKDQQVKIQGFRVELEEVHACLLTREEVKQAVVIDWKEKHGQKVLCAYLLLEEGVTFSTESLRLSLEKELPSYMVPRYFVVLDQLPLTENGKVDRRALPSPIEDQNSKEKQVGPRNALEEKMVAAWQEILQISQVSIYDDFFALGGDSIKAIRLVHHLAEKGISLEIYQLFQAPTIAELQSRVTWQEDLLQLPDVVENPSDWYKPFPLTEIQLAYLVGRESDLELGGVATHSYIEFETQLDITRFNQSLCRIIDRHPMLRAIMTTDGQQRVLTEVPAYQIVVEDLRDFSQLEQERRLLSERERMSHQVFSPFEWPLFEWKAFRLTDEESLLCYSCDALIVDGASINLMLQEILTDYHDPQQLTPAPQLHFRDYLLAYDQRKESPLYQKARKYWLRKLDTFPEAPSLPLKQEPNQLKQPHFRTLSYRMPREKWQAIKRYAQQMQVTPSSLLLTAYGEVLARWSNQERLAINLSVFNRSPIHPEVDRIVGDFTSLIVLELQLSPGQSFLEHVRRTQLNMAEGLAHRYFDGVSFMRELNRYHQGDRQVIMPVVFTSLLLGEGEYSWDDIGRVRFMTAQTPQVYLDHIVTEQKGELVLTWHYVEALFDQEQIGRQFAQYIALVEKAVQFAELKQLPLPDHDDQIIRSTNQTAVIYEPKLLFQPLLEQVQKRPEQWAVIDGQGERLSYAQLEREANRVAHYLVQQGVKRSSLVAVEARRNWETLVMILGCLKAGAAYVPIDPAFPKQRQQHLLKHAQVSIYLTTDFYRKHDWLCYPSFSPNVEMTPQDRAYVLYTSGTTGEPKGVIMTHAAVMNTLEDIQRRFALQPGDRVLGLSALNFDLSVFDLFGTWSAGATLVLIEEPRQLDKVIQTMLEQKVTVWNSVPALLELVVDQLKTTYDGLRLVLLSGDWIPLTLPERAQRTFPRAKFISLGGATEAAIWSILHPITEVKKSWKSIPYGRPLSNQMFYILNFAGELCPVGTVGELYIGGMGLAEGYLHDPEQTEAAFIQHPQWGRLYRTGDFGRYLDNGEIEFLGRRDQQVKILGYRVELEEIRQVILLQPHVKQAVVTLRDQQIYAYVVGGKALSITDLQSSLAKRLPRYMLPARFILLEALPFTSNGKIDYQALPKPEQEIEFACEPVLPRSKKERLLVEIWQQVFGKEQIGVKENFIALGGESIKAIQINAQLAAHQYTLPIGDYFRYPTIAELAPRLQRKKQTTVAVTTEEIPLTAIQRMALQLRQQHDNWSIEMLWPRADGWNADIVRSVFTALLQHHDALRICFEKRNQQVVQRYRKVEEVPLVVDEYDLLQEANARHQMAVIAEQLHRSLNWLKGNLFRLAIFHTAEQDWLLLVIDHLIFDNLSQHILQEDLQKGYQQALQQKALQFPSKTTSYQEWSQALQTYAYSDQLLSEVPYWQKIHEEPTVSLPYDWPDQQGERRFRDLHSVQWSLLPEQTGQLFASAYKTCSANRHDLLLAAFLRALKDWTNGNQVAIELFSHGREAIEPQINLSRTIGWFTSLYPVLFDLQQDSFRDTIAEVQMRLEQVPQKGMGYLPLKYMSPATSKTWHKQPLADISFNYLGQVQVTQFSNPEFFQIEWPHSLHLVAYLMPDQSLMVHLHYNRYLYRRQTIEKLSQRMQEYLLKGL